MNLMELTTPAGALRRVECDVSAFYGQPEKTLVTVWQEADIPALDRMADDARLFKQRNLEWPDQTCYTVAYLSHCHIAPEPPAGNVSRANVREYGQRPQLSPGLRLSHAGVQK